MAANIRQMTKRFASGLGAMLGAMLFVAFAFLTSPRAAFAEEGVTRIHILPFDYQDAIIIESDGQFGMVDSGESEDYPDGSDPRYPFRPGTTLGQGSEEQVICYMKSIGVTSDNLVFYIGTHPHSDHIGSAPQIISEFKPKRVYTPKYDDSYITNSGALWDNRYVYDRLVKAAADNGAVLIQDFDVNAPVTPDDGASVGNPTFPLGQATIEICNTDNSDCVNGLPDANCLSYGVKVTANGKTAFLSGDINNLDGDEDRLAQSLGHIDFLKLGHHGNIYSNTSSYLKAISPSLAFMTGNVRYTPLDTLDALDDMGTRLFESSDCRNEGEKAFVVELGSSGLNFNLDVPGVQLHYNSLCGSYIAYEDGLRKELNGWQKTEDGFTWFDDCSVSVNDKWITDGGATYYINKQSMMSTGWARYGSDWYWFNDAGAMQTGWIKLTDGWYYLAQDGAMVTGRQIVDGRACVFDSNGLWHGYEAVSKGWEKVGGTWYYFGGDGSMRVGWAMVDGSWYYLRPSGAMATGWEKVGGTWYYFGGDGSMRVGWAMVDGSWYYLRPSGAMATGWEKVGGTWYYMYPSGAMASNYWCGNYYLGETGAMAINQWIGPWWVGDDGLWVPGYAE